MFTMSYGASVLSSDFEVYDKNHYFWKYRNNAIETVHFSTHKPWWIDTHPRSAVLCTIFREWLESMSDAPQSRMKPLPIILDRCPPTDDAELRMNQAKQMGRKKGLITKLHEIGRGDGGKKGEEQMVEQSREEATPIMGEKVKKETVQRISGNKMVVKKVKDIRGDGGKRGEEKSEEQSREKAMPIMGEKVRKETFQRISGKMVVKKAKDIRKRQRKKIIM